MTGPTDIDLDIAIQRERLRLGAGTAPPAPSGGVVDTLRGAVNTVGQAVRGGVDRAAELIGAPIDLVGTGLQALGMPAPQHSAGESLKYAARQALGGDVAPADPTETFARGAGEGVVDAATTIVPGMALARGANAAQQAGRALTLGQRVGQVLTTNPGVQTVAGAVGGGVTETTGSALAGAAAAMATPFGLAGVKRAITPGPSRLTPEEQRLAGVAAAEDIPLSPGEATGSRPMKALESLFRTLPTTANRAAGQKQEQAQKFNRAVLDRAGITGDSADPTTLLKQREHLGREFQRLIGSTTLNYDGRFHTDIMRTAMQYGQRLDVQMRPIFDNYVRDLMQTQGLDGTTYQNVRSELTRLTQSYRQNNPELSHAMRGLRDALDDLAERQIDPKLRGQWKETRKQWGNLRAIEEAMESSTTTAGSGNIPPTAWYQANRRRNPGTFATGRSPNYDLARVGTQFVRDNVPNSGTPERAFWQSLLTGQGVGGTTLLAGGEPTTAALAVAGALGGPWAAKRIYDSPLIDMWLRNQLMPGRYVTQNTLGGIALQQGGSMVND